MKYIETCFGNLVNFEHVSRFFADRHDPDDWHFSSLIQIPNEYVIFLDVPNHLSLSNGKTILMGEREIDFLHNIALRFIINAKEIIIYHEEIDTWAFAKLENDALENPDKYSYVKERDDNKPITRKL